MAFSWTLVLVLITLSKLLIQFEIQHVIFRVISILNAMSTHPRPLQETF